MNREKYREAIDRLPIPEDFEDRTIELLRRQLRDVPGKETEMMKRTKHKKAFWRVAIAVCLAAVLSVGGLATAGLLSAREASKFLDNEAMKKAFQGENAIEIDETQMMGDYTVTLLGIASGKDLQEYGATDSTHNYYMIAVQGNDGASVDDFLGNYKVTPLVSGYSVIMADALNVSGNGANDGDILYFCYDITGLELFADHTVYLAVYKQGFPVDVDGAWCYQAGDVLTMAEDGSISFREDFPEEHTMFILPLDESKADPVAAEQLLENCPWPFGYNLQDPTWNYSESYHEKQQKALEEAELK